MAYTKTTWNTGDVITAEKLNHMEDGITSAQAYTVSDDVRFSGSVTTAEEYGAYTARVDCDLSDTPEQIKVTFDGTEYTCEKIAVGGNVVYGGVGSGGPDFSEYPFAVNVATHNGAYINGAYIYAETASTHQVEITALTKSVNQDLADVIPVMRLVNGVTNSADAVAAFSAGKLLYFTYNDAFYYIVTGIDAEKQMFVSIPDNGQGCYYSNDKIIINYQSV